MVGTLAEHRRSQRCVEPQPQGPVSVGMPLDRARGNAGRVARRCTISFDGIHAGRAPAQRPPALPGVGSASTRPVLVPRDLSASFSLSAEACPGTERPFWKRVVRPVRPVRVLGRSLSADRSWMPPGNRTSCATGDTVPTARNGVWPASNLPRRRAPWRRRRAADAFDRSRYGVASSRSRKPTR